MVVGGGEGGRRSVGRVVVGGGEGGCGSMGRVVVGVWGGWLCEGECGSVVGRMIVGGCMWEVGEGVCRRVGKVGRLRV